MSKQEDWYQQD